MLLFSTDLLWQWIVLGRSWAVHHPLAIPLKGRRAETILLDHPMGCSHSNPLEALVTSPWSQETVFKSTFLFLLVVFPGLSLENQDIWL